MRINSCIHAIAEYIVRKNAVIITNQFVRVKESFPHRIIIPAPQIIQPGFLIIHIPAIPERVERADCVGEAAGLAKRSTLHIMVIFYHLYAFVVNKGCDIALHIGLVRNTCYQDFGFVSMRSV